MTVTTVIARQVKYTRTPVEECLLRSIAADAAGGLDCAFYDKTLSHAPGDGAGLLVQGEDHAPAHVSSSGVLPDDDCRTPFYGTVELMATVNRKQKTSVAPIKQKTSVAPINTVDTVIVHWERHGAGRRLGKVSCDVPQR